MNVAKALIASLFVATAVMAEHGSERSMQLLCPNKSSSEIAAAITDAGGDLVTFGFDGGEYSVTNSISFSSNITVKVYPGSSFAVSSGVVMDFNTNNFIAGASLVFSGAGTATGAVDTVYRWPEWGDTSQFNIGSGALGGGGGTVLTSQNNTYDGGTLQAFALASATNFSIGGVAIDAWSDLAPLIVYTNSGFAGYPALTLSTNMITIDHSAVGNNLAITNATFVNAFDGNTNTFTGIGISDNGIGTYTLDLGASYRGFVVVDATTDPTASSWASILGIGATEQVPTYTANRPRFGSLGDSLGEITGTTLGYNTGASDNYRIINSIPFVGRYVNIIVYENSGFACTYKFSIIEVYGVAR